MMDYIKRYGAFIFIFVLPPIIVRSSEDEVHGRILASSIIYVGYIFLALCALLNDDFHLIPRWAKLYKIYTEKKVKLIELIMRIAFSLIVIYIFLVASTPFIQDAQEILLNDKSHIKIEATVVSRSEPVGGLWFFYQNLYLKEYPNDHYFFFYPTDRLSQGEKYEFTILPRSTTILKVRKI